MHFYTFKKSTAISVLFTCTILLVVILSCSNDHVAPSFTATQLLTKQTWQLDETIQQVGNVQAQYKRNGINTTGSEYSRVRLSFKPDGTGSMIDALNNTYSLTWAFKPNDETKMTVIVNYPVPATINYTLINLTENYFMFTLYYSTGTQQALAANRYVPFP